jgi:hypothetical protein
MPNMRGLGFYLFVYYYFDLIYLVLSVQEAWVRPQCTTTWFWSAKYTLGPSERSESRVCVKNHQDRTTRLRGPLKSEPRFSFSYSFGRHPTSLQIVHEEAKKSNHHSVQLISSLD